MRMPDPPTEKSPDTGSAVWIPRNSVRRMPSPTASMSADGGSPPGAKRRLEIPTVGGTFGLGRLGAGSAGVERIVHDRDRPRRHLPADLPGEHRLPLGDLGGEERRDQ